MSLPRFVLLSLLLFAFGAFGELFAPVAKTASCGVQEQVSSLQNCRYKPVHCTPMLRGTSADEFSGLFGFPRDHFYSFQIDFMHQFVRESSACVVVAQPPEIRRRVLYSVLLGGGHIRIMRLANGYIQQEFTL